MKTIPAALLCSALFLAACGSDDPEADSTDEASADTESADTEPADTEPPATEAPAGTEPATEAPAETEPPATDAPVETEAPADTEPPATDPSAAGGGNAAAGGMTMNGLRYCEILMTVPGDDGEPVTEVWGTPGVDPCDDAAWNAIDPDQVAADNGASFLDMNGPRFFTVDGTVDTGGPSADGGGGIAAGGETVTAQYGGVTMALLATIDGASETPVPYVPELVVRTTTWAFDAGTEVYELIDPDGDVYTMQSYSHIVDTSIAAADLPTLGDRLDLPEGWTYSSRVLEEPLVVELAEGGALVVNDDLRNSYQRNG
ncbi:MAG: hypothetical protein AAGD33_03995 [Actinomycetota bacterium]